jgi:dUTP pyrophosphatase
MSAFMKALTDKFQTFAVLKLVVPNPDLAKKYQAHVEAHNLGLFANGAFANSGFDLLVPSTTVVAPGMKTQMLSMDVKSEMLFQGTTPCGYFMFPRSSLSKTPLMLANHTGIIDAGYRGSLIGAFRNLLGEEYVVEENTRLLQVCHPSLCPVYVILSNENELSITERAEGGFGSTGK